MADPIGLSASLLTLADAAVCIGDFVRQLRQCPAEVLALNNEINDLRYVLLQVEAAHNDGEVPGLAPLLNRSRHVFDQIDHLLGRFRSDGQRQLSMMDRMHFSMLLRERVQQCVRQLREVRFQLDTLLVASTARSVASLHRTVERLQLSVIAPSTQPPPEILIEVDDEKSMEAEVVPVSDTGIAEKGALALITNTGEASETGPSLPPAAVALHTQQCRVCRPLCSCRCHAPSWYTTPNMLNQVLGQLFVGYDGNAFRSLKCDVLSCSRISAGPKARATYFFPAWFVSRAIDAAVYRRPFGDFTSTLTIRGVQSRNSPVFEAVASGNIPWLQQLFTSGAARPSDIDHEGHTLLFSAVAYRRPETVRFLLDAGSDPHYPNKDRISAFDRAWDGIITCGALNNTSKHFARDIFNDTRELDAWQLTRIHRIVLGFLPYDLKQELELSITELDEPDSHGRTPLWWAVAVADENAVETLLEYGANPDTADIEGAPPLRKATAADRLDIFFQLLSVGANPNWKTTLGMQISHTVMSYNLDINYLESSLNPELDLNTRGGYSGNTPLLIAVRANNVLHVQWLLQHGVEVNKPDREGYTPLMQAVLRNHHLCIAALLKAGADMTIDAGRSKGTIWGQAITFGNRETLDELAAAGIGGYFDPSDIITSMSAWDMVHLDGYGPGARAAMLRMLCTSECERCILDAQAGVSASVSLEICVFGEGLTTPARSAWERYEAFPTDYCMSHDRRQQVPHTHRPLPEGWVDKHGIGEDIIVCDDGRVFMRSMFTDIWFLRPPLKEDSATANKMSSRPLSKEEVQDFKAKYPGYLVPHGTMPTGWAGL